jgi:hypothetical protein
MTEKKVVDKTDKEDVKPLDIELLQVGEYLFGRIKNQNDDLRIGVNFEFEGIKIFSDGGGPQLYKENCKCTTLYLRGNNKVLDHGTFMAKYNNEKEASKWADKLVKAIDAFNKDPITKVDIPPEPLKCKRIMG